MAKRTAQQPRLSDDDFHKLQSKWLGWLNRLSAHVMRLHADRAVAGKVIDVIQRNPKLQQSNLLLDWMLRNYDATTLITVRRLMDKDKKAVSLRRLVQDITDNAIEYTRERYVVDWVRRYSADAIRPERHIIEVQYRGGSVAVDMGPNKYDDWIETIVRDANSHFDIYSGPNCDTVSQDALDERLTTTTKAVEKVIFGVDKHVAHLEDGSPTTDLTYGDLDEAIDAVGDLYKYLSILLTGSTPQELEPVVQCDWEWVFHEPWSGRTQSQM